MQLFYNNKLQLDSTELVFDKTESRHILKVLRKNEGDLLSITNGKDLLFTGRITDADEKKCRVQIIEISVQKPNRDYSISIAIAPTKNNTRFEWFLEKATEIGVDEIYPILCRYSERKLIKHERMQRVLQTAMKQSLQFKLPKLNQLGSFDDLISQKRTGQKLIAVCEHALDNPQKNKLYSQIKSGSDVLILIGPEGGFSPNEIEKALQYSFIPVSLGTTRLRTETAGIVAVHTVSLKNKGE